MKEKPIFLNNEKGSVLIVAVIFLMLLTVLGIFATTTSTIELQISGNDKINKMVFYAADSGVPFVSGNPDWYGPNNIDGEETYFSGLSADKKECQLSDKLKIVIGNVTCLGKSQMPAGAGYSAGTIFAINYQLTSTGTGPNNGSSKIEAGFYRIGL